MQLRIPRPPPHRLAVRQGNKHSDQTESHRHGHEEHERRDEPVRCGPVVDEVCHAELWKKMVRYWLMAK